MKIIIGLGNPGKEYENTKHNLGFMFLDFLNKNYLGGEFKTFKNSKIIEGNIDNEKVILAKPQTYMNLSGDAVIKLKSWYKVDNNDITDLKITETSEEKEEHKTIVLKDNETPKVDDDGFVSLD